MILSVGPELRRGYHRIQGYAGLNVIYGYEALKDVSIWLRYEINSTRNNADFIVAPAPIAFANWTQTYVTGRYHGGLHYIGLEEL